MKGTNSALPHRKRALFLLRNDTKGRLVRSLSLALAGRAEQGLARMCAHGTLQREDGQETCKAAT